MYRLGLLFGIALLISSCGGVDKNTGDVAQASQQDTIVPAIDSLKGSYDEFSFVAYNQYLLLGKVDSTWSKAKPKTYVNRQDACYSVTTDVDQSKIPDSLQAAVGKSFRVYAKDGSSKLVKIRSLKLFAICIPHSGLMRQWEGLDESEVVKPPLSKPEIAREIWKMSAFYIAAEFESIAEETNYEIAVSAVRPQPEIYTSIDSKNAVAVLKKLTKTANYRKAQKVFLSFDGMHGNWWQQEDSQQEINCFKNKKGTVFTLVGHTVGSPCGDDIYTQRFSFWKTEIGKDPELIAMEDDFIGPIMVFDLNGDGKPEYLVDEFLGSISLRSSAGEKKLKEWFIPFFECGC